MRRDYFELDVQNIAWEQDGGEPCKPSVRIDFQGPDELLTDRLSDGNGELLDAEDVDVSYRLLDTNDETTDTDGVVSVTNRLTGDFILELNADADDVLRFISAAREFGRSGDSDGEYCIYIELDGTKLVEYNKGTFLVYDASGNLLRTESLIPSGVEL